MTEPRAYPICANAACGRRAIWRVGVRSGEPQYRCEDHPVVGFLGDMIPPPKHIPLDGTIEFGPLSDGGEVTVWGGATQEELKARFEEESGWAWQ